MALTRDKQLLPPDSSSIAAQSVASGVIAIVSNVIQMIIGIGTTLVLVRIIGPDDYGVYMMAAI
ncbi:MAG: hypothetical protein AAFN41_12025, partial [Planctomycetota bacterium]